MSDDELDQLAPWNEKVLTILRLLEKYADPLVRILDE